MERINGVASREPLVALPIRRAQDEEEDEIWMEETEQQQIEFALQA